LKEDYYWKNLIDEFKDGIALVNKNKKISYKNNPVNSFFGLENKGDNF